MENIKLNFINNSQDINKSKVVIFQMNIAEKTAHHVAWKVVENCGQHENHPFEYPLSFKVSASDSYGNNTPMFSACQGEVYQMVKSPSGHVLQLAGSPAQSPNEVEVRNDLLDGAINANIYRDGKLLAVKTNIAPEQKAAFQFHPKLFIGVNSQVQEGELMNSAIIKQVNTELNLFGIESADIVMTGGGAGESSIPYTFHLENINYFAGEGVADEQLESKSSTDKDLLNKMIKKELPKINSGIQHEIKEQHLDPWGHIAHGKETLGHVNLGFVKVAAKADYNVGKMKGLSSFTIHSIDIQSLEANPKDKSQLAGHLYLKASLKKDLSTHVGGGIRATFKNWIHNFSEHVGISGTGTVTGIGIKTTGSFVAKVKDGKVCLMSASFKEASVDFKHIHIHIDGLGFFNDFISPLTDAFIGLFKKEIKHATASAITSIINSEMHKVLPLCE